MNVKLLRDVKEAILHDPDSFRMDQWSWGTAHCIAGWALLLRDIPVEFVYSQGHMTVSGEWPGDVAKELLELSGRQPLRLFHVQNWPTSFRDRYCWADDRRGRAEVAAERIDHFIATRGAE